MIFTQYLINALITLTLGGFSPTRDHQHFVDRNGWHFELIIDENYWAETCYHADAIGLPMVYDWSEFEDFDSLCTNYVGRI